MARSLGKWLWPRTMGILETPLPPFFADGENGTQKGRSSPSSLGLSTEEARKTVEGGGRVGDEKRQ